MGRQVDTLVWRKAPASVLIILLFVSGRYFWADCLGILVLYLLAEMLLLEVEHLIILSIVYLNIISVLVILQTVWLQDKAHKDGYQP